MIYKPHADAAIFPQMSADEFAALKADIAEHGLREPLVLHEGRILDGRNRYRACRELGIEPRCRQWANGESTFGFVVSANLHRRHLTPSQRAMIALEIERRLAAEAKQRQSMSKGRGKKGVANLPQVFRGKSRDQAAKLVGVSSRMVSEAKTLAREAPELAAKVRGGEIRIEYAKRQLTEQRREARRKENRAVVNAAPTISAAIGTARFATIVVDPPWDYQDMGEDNIYGRTKEVYATISIDKVRELPVAKLADDDCHLYLWVPNRMLPVAFSVFEPWGFRYVTCLTWCKPSFGIGKYFRGQTEHVLFAIRGSQPLKRRDVGTCFAAPRGPGGHSSKPDEFYKLVESCSPGPYLDVFARRVRAGWVTWGGELTASA